MSFVATWMGLEIIILSEVSQTDKDNYFQYLYVESKKYDTNESTYKMETDSQTQTTYLWLPKGKGVGDKLGVWD